MSGATRMVQHRKNYSYEARLRGDLIQVYNILARKYNTHPTVKFSFCPMFLTLQVLYIKCN